MNRTPTLVRRKGAHPFGALSIYLLLAFGLGALEFALITTPFGWRPPTSYGLMVIPVAWLITATLAIVVHGWRGLWTLGSAPLIGYPLYVIWYISNGCPGGDVCL